MYDSYHLMPRPAALRDLVTQKHFQPVLIMKKLVMCRVATARWSMAAEDVTACSII